MLGRSVDVEPSLDFEVEAFIRATAKHFFGTV